MRFEASIRSDPTNRAPGSDAAGGRVAVRVADAADVPPVLALLATAGLPLDGAAAAFIHGVVADLRGEVVGAAAVERYGPDGLLRSVVVREDLRGTGLGRALVAAAEERAADLGVRDLYLLTETAAGSFVRLGYAAMERTAAPAGIAGSWEFRFACAERGVLMHRALGD